MSCVFVQRVKVKLEHVYSKSHGRLQQLIALLRPLEPLSTVYCVACFKSLNKAFLKKKKNLYYCSVNE